MMKLVLGVGVAAYLAWARIRDRRRLRDLDLGRVCADCGSREVSVVEQIATCERCGAERDLEKSRAHALTEEELSSLYDRPSAH